MTDPVKLNAAGKDLDLKVLSGSVGPDVIDIRKLYAQTGMFTYDPGFTSTASLIGHSAAPVADCEAEGCNQPRIVDGLAEQYRFSAVQQPQPQHEEPVEPDNFH